MANLTVSSNEITDATRPVSGGNQSDGRGSVNLIDNGGVETNLLGWDAIVPGTISRVTTGQKSGTACIQVAITGAYGGLRRDQPLDATPHLISVIAGSTYTFQWWWNRVSGASSNVAPLVSWFTAGGAFVSNTIGGTLTVPSTYTNGTYTAVAPATAAYATPTLQDQGAGSVVTFNVDNLQFEPGSVATAYMDTNGSISTVTNDSSYAIYPAATNIALQSNHLNTTPWAPAGLTVGENGATGPYGNSDANLITGTAGAQSLAQPITVSPSTAYTASFHARAGTKTSAAYRVGVTNPTLTTSGNEITDASRATNTQGDGLSNDSSFGIWPAATNELWFDGTQNSTTGFSTLAGATLSASTTGAVFNGYSLQVVTPNVAAGEGVTITMANAPPNATTYTASIWLSGTGTVYISITDGVTQRAQSVVVTLTGTPTRYRLTGTTNTVNKLVVQVYTATQQAATIRPTGWQLELGSVATPLVHVNGANATRAAARVQAPAALINATQSWFAAQTRPEWAAATPIESGARLFYWLSGDGLNAFEASFTANSFNFRRRDASGDNYMSVATSFTAGSVDNFIISWTATQIAISINGTAFVTQANTKAPVGLGTTVEIGGQFTTPLQFGGEMLWSAVGTGVLSNADATTINGFGNTDPTQASFPTTAQCTAVMPFNTASFQRDLVQQTSYYSQINSSTYTRVDVPFTTPSDVTSVTVYPESETAGSAGTMAIWQVQTETGPIATPRINTTTASATRAAARVQQLATAVGEVQGAISVSLTMDWASTNPPTGNRIAFEWVSADFTNQFVIFYSGSGVWTFQLTRNGTVTTTSRTYAHNAGDTVILTIAWTNSTLSVSHSLVGGGAFAAVTRLGTAGGTALPLNFDIGQVNGGDHVGTRVNWVLAMAGQPSNADITMLAALGRTDPTLLTLSAASISTAVWPAVDSSYSIVSAVGPFNGKAGIRSLWSGKVGVR